MAKTPAPRSAPLEEILVGSGNNLPPTSQPIEPPVETTGPIVTTETLPSANEPPEDLTLGELAARQGVPLMADAPSPTVRVEDYVPSGIIRDTVITDAVEGAEMPPPPPGFSLMPQSGPPLASPSDIVQRPTQPLSYMDFVNSGYDRAKLDENKAQVAEWPPKLNLVPGVRFESRIRVTEAWQYIPREFASGAPAWVDRNWLAYESADTLRGIPAGPVLKVPTGDGVLTVCRPGDVLVKQEVLVDESRSYQEIEVWSIEQFMRMFMIVRGSEKQIDAA